MKGLLRYVAAKMVARFPKFALNVLRESHPELIPRNFNRPNGFDWDTTRAPTDVAGFEDLAFLFWPTPLNRGLLRMDIDEAAALFKAIRSTPNARGAEIGRFKGGSTVLLACAVGSGGTLLSIDICPPNDQGLRAALAAMRLENRVDIRVADANTVEHDGGLDFVFIDGDHSIEGARKDHNCWGPRVRPGGLIIHHDMGNGRPLSTQWDSLAALRRSIDLTQAAVLECVQEVGSIVIFRRRIAPWTPVLIRPV